MQMGDESDFEICWFQSFDTFAARGRGAPDGPRANVNQIWNAVDHDGGARP